MDLGFLLLPGGGMSSWLWERVVPLLNGVSITPSYRLPENSYALRITATIADCVDYHISLVENSNLDRVVVVGHSGAGALAAAISAKIPEKIISAVYISASLPKNNHSSLDELPLFLRIMNSIAIKSQVKKDTTSNAKRIGMIRKYFCNTCSEDIVQEVGTKEMLSEPLCLAFEKYNFDTRPGLRQLYVLLTKDKTQSVSAQKNMMKNRNVTDCIEVESDHMVMLSNPGVLAEILNRELLIA